MAAYFTAVETDVNIVFTLVPIEVTTVTIAIDRVPAMIAYSIAVAPQSFLRNRAPSPMRPLTGRLPHKYARRHAHASRTAHRESHAKAKPTLRRSIEFDDNFHNARRPRGPFRSSLV